MNKKIEEKKREKEEYANPHTGRERLSYWKIGLMTMAATSDAKKTFFFAPCFF